MARSNPYAPTPADRFTFGLWTVGNPGRDPFGEPTRAPMAPGKIVELLGEVGGVYGVNFHDNDLIPIDATANEAAAIKRDFRKALRQTRLRVPMATTNLFSDPVFKDGAFTSNDADVRAYALQKTMRGMELGAEFGARIYVFWGGREGAETDAAKDPVLAVQRTREAMNYLCRFNRDRGLRYRFALEAKPNEPRAHIYNAVTGSCLAFIQTLDDPDMVGVNPEVAHEHMAGLNFVHQVAAALDAGKLFHIDLNDQEFGRYDQDLRFGSVNIKHAFFLVKLLTDCGYRGNKHFDSHAYRTSDVADVKAFAAGSMRNWKILESKVHRFNSDRGIQSILKQVNRHSRRIEAVSRKYTKKNAAALLDEPFDRASLAQRPLPYEKLDQLVIDLLMGVR
jgi:xylose isomerase